ncbi:bifunctional riboflavin kinase/FAD synthetase [Salinisphaera sp.]|uniref:bifunctional riboflavin kinase/FAD synthetase n=1 Tax=Salinisphaera sp. TaxID=1914330 RepID=UPI000C444C56|nr:bifunctional riboflavin kinase/FAD synthetase [Salinisphaera sp.]MBS63467.1 bifunctional riboflavin kinase/FMN adenylyltransferase [Salinisphaera sp.]
MRVVRNVRRMGALDAGCALTIGNFDGLHRGHQAIVRQLRERAQTLGVPSVLMSFEPMPREFFAPESAPARLSSPREKMRMAQALGVDIFAWARFDAAFAGMSPHAFLEDLLSARLNAHYLLVGEDFRFGQKRAGDIETLRAFAHDREMEVAPLPDVQVDGARVSSTRVRDALAAGDVDQANRLLGHAYWVSGRVVRGERLGRTLGFPTANIRLARKPAPRFGVYAVWVYMADGVRRAGAASFGVRPTVNGREPLLEVFVLDFDGDLYGQRIDVSFEAFIRAEERYDSLEALTAQMHRDVERVRSHLQEPKSP